MSRRRGASSPNSTSAPYLRGPAVPAPPTAAGDPAASAVQELLKFRMRYGRPHVLVGWAGREASGDTREPREWLTRTSCEAALTASKQATGPAPPPPPLPPTGFTVDAAPPGGLGAALVGRQLL
jgi:hypothetical protein